MALNGSNNPRISFDTDRIRADFPIFSEPVGGKPFIYLDNAATTQKPAAVINTLTRFYEREYASVHRGTYHLSEMATQLFEGTREKVRRFIHAASFREIIFVRGATEGINLVAQTYGRAHVKPGDEILISVMEHHSNIVPWQMLCDEKGARLLVIPMSESGELTLDHIERLLGPKTRLVAITHVSNSIGTINPIREIIRLAHSRNVPVLVDGAQSASRMPIDVQAMDCDFFTFSGHKMYGPTGIGVLYGKEALLNSMPPYQGGGDMIRSVTFGKTLYSELPYKFEAGTPNMAGVIGLGAAVDYLDSIGMDKIFAHEQDLLSWATQALSNADGVSIIGAARRKCGILSLVFEGLHPHDVGTVLDHEGIAVRAGHQCAQPVMDFYKINATVRVSFGLYNTRQDIDALFNGLKRIKEVFG